MNCFQHPDAAVAAYCQNCGKPLCSQCVRSVNGVIYCETCLAAKMNQPGAAIPPVPPVPPMPSMGPNPGLAALLGVIPGVGAMYNGQFIKALVHVLVFVVLIGITSHHGVLGLFIPAWVIYQIFDAYHTARARREGLPLPDPFGLNELGHRLGFQAPPSSPAPGAVPNPAAYSAAYSAPPYTAAPGYTGQPYTPYPAPGYTEVPPAAIPPPEPHRREPIGAIVLIGLGLLFLFGTLGVFSFDWVGRGWPILVIGVGIWLLVRRTRGSSVPPGGAQ